MLASSTCAVQMFDVAFSRRMCCSRVCSARRSAGPPGGVGADADDAARAGRGPRARWAAMNAACGPPKPIGTPKRCAEPTAMSAPSWPGGVVSTHASRSVATTARPPPACTRSIAAAPVDDRAGRRRQAEQGAEAAAVDVVDVADDELDADRLGPRGAARRSSADGCRGGRRSGRESDRATAAGPSSSPRRPRSPRRAARRWRRAARSAR